MYHSVPVSETDDEAFCRALLSLAATDKPCLSLRQYPRHSFSEVRCSTMQSAAVSSSTPHSGQQLQCMSVRKAKGLNHGASNRSPLRGENLPALCFELHFSRTEVAGREIPADSEREVSANAPQGRLVAVFSFPRERRCLASYQPLSCRVLWELLWRACYTTTRGGNNGS